MATRGAAPLIASGETPDPVGIRCSSSLSGILLIAVNGGQRGIP
jgi:hypothetical protein